TLSFLDLLVCSKRIDDRHGPVSLSMTEDFGIQAGDALSDHGLLPGSTSGTSAFTLVRRSAATILTSSRMLSSAAGVMFLTIGVSLPLHTLCFTSKVASLL